MLMTISCKNQTKSVGTFPTCGTESRNKSEHFRLLGQKVGTFPTFETCWTNLLSSCPCLRSLAWRRLGRACTFGFASGRAGQDLHHELRRLRRRRSLRRQHMGEVMRGTVLTSAGHSSTFFKLLEEGEREGGREGGRGRERA